MQAENEISANPRDEALKFLSENHITQDMEHQNRWYSQQLVICGLQKYHQNYHLHGGGFKGL
jgi:hypothetical protein